MKYTYIPKGVCSSRMEFEIEGGVLRDLAIEDGCEGNLSGMAALAKGRNVDELMELLKGIKCGRKRTSCPDQLAKAIAEALEQEAAERP